jgi:hypothetical protein
MEKVGFGLTGMEEVGFGPTGLAWNGGSWVWSESQGLVSQSYIATRSLNWSRRFLTTIPFLDHLMKFFILIIVTLCSAKPLVIFSQNPSAGEPRMSTNISLTFHSSDEVPCVFWKVIPADDKETCEQFSRTTTFCPPVEFHDNGVKLLHCSVQLSVLSGSEEHIHFFLLSSFLTLLHLKFFTYPHRLSQLVFELFRSCFNPNSK